MPSAAKYLSNVPAKSVVPFSSISKIFPNGKPACPASRFQGKVDPVEVVGRPLSGKVVRRVWFCISDVGTLRPAGPAELSFEPDESPIFRFRNDILNLSLRSIERTNQACKGFPAPNRLVFAGRMTSNKNRGLGPTCDLRSSSEYSLRSRIKEAQENNKLKFGDP